MFPRCWAATCACSRAGNAFYQDVAASREVGLSACIEAMRRALEAAGARDCRPVDAMLHRMMPREAFNRKRSPARGRRTADRPADRSGCLRRATRRHGRRARAVLRARRDHRRIPGRRAERGAHRGFLTTSWIPSARSMDEPTQSGAICRRSSSRPRSKRLCRRRDRQPGAAAAEYAGATGSRRQKGESGKRRRIPGGSAAGGGEIAAPGRPSPAKTARWSASAKSCARRSARCKTA